MPFFKSGSGVPPPFCAVRIVRDDGTDAKPGEIGEIAGHSPILMEGYYKRPDLTAEALRDGWLYSGDMGYLDDDGYLYLVDRKKDMIDSGGVKVYPRDIEEIAARHPDILDITVFGVPHDKWGEVPLATVILRDGAMQRRGAARLDQRAVDARYQRVAGDAGRLPRNAAGKILKRELRVHTGRPRLEI
jgi:acyl-CoA synthetase (AMP-forming)/AMP-acid ligase II